VGKNIENKFKVQIVRGASKIRLSVVFFNMCYNK